MKKFLAVLTAAAMSALLFTGFTARTSAASDAQLKAALAKTAPGKTVYYFKSVSIGGGKRGAFAITASQQSAGGDVYYVTASRVQKLMGFLAFPNSTPDTPYLWQVGGTSMFKCENDAGGSGSASCVWYIKNGKPVKLLYTGMSFTYAGNGQFTTIGQAFDQNYTDGLGTGHTYKYYYFYWKSGSLHEYGGRKISKQQLLKITGAKAVLSTLTSAGKTIGDIYYRANGIINVNYHTGNKKNGEFDNVNLLYKNNTVTPQPAESSGSGDFSAGTLDKYSFGGSYKAALFPKIAKYPRSFLKK